MRKKIKRLKRQTAGVTLVEVLIVLTIVLSLAAAGIPAYQYARTRSDLRSVTESVRTISSTLSLYELSEGYGGAPPITEILADGEASIAISGTMGGITPNAINAGTFFDLEKVFVGARVLEAPLAIYNGDDPLRPDNTIDPVWNAATNRFTTTADAAPNYSQIRRTTLECALSTNMGAPTLTTPGRFTLTTGTAIDDHHRIVYWRIPNTPTSIAQAIAKKLNGKDAANISSAQTTGVVNYPTPINGVTTVYVYIKHY